MTQQAPPKTDDDVVRMLKDSLSTLGQVAPVVRCKQHPKVILSGRHRVAAGASDFVDLDIDDRADQLGQNHDVTEQLVKIHSNLQRQVSRKERQQEFVTLARIIERKTPKNEVAKKVAELVGPAFSEAYVYELLPDDYKDATRAKAITRGMRRTKLNSVEFPESAAKNETKAHNPVAVQDNRITGELASKVFAFYKDGGRPEDAVIHFSVLPEVANQTYNDFVRMTGALLFSKESKEKIDAIVKRINDDTAFTADTYVDFLDVLPDILDQLESTAVELAKFEYPCGGGCGKTLNALYDPEWKWILENDFMKGWVCDECAAKHGSAG